jgi:glyoxalase superfamily protein
VSLGKTTPIRRIFDEPKAKEFDVAFLGFHVDWEHRFEPGLSLLHAGLEGRVPITGVPRWHWVRPMCEPGFDRRSRRQ